MGLAGDLPDELGRLSACQILSLQQRSEDAIAEECHLDRRLVVAEVFDLVTTHAAILLTPGADVCGQVRG
jgi:hypothetical protein